MALQNIGAGNKDDAFYRYKMPKMLTKIEGRGNGIKTNIVNMVDIAKALGRPATYTTKYFGCELGAQSKFDEKTGTSLVNGAHETRKLAQLLENFIKKFVQCYGCGNPETEVIVTKSQMITLKCAACGFVSDVDMRDKLTTFILKNPPEQKKAKDKSAMRRAEKERLKEGQAADEEQKKLKKDTKKKTTVAPKKETSSKVAVIKKKNGGSSDEDHSTSPVGSMNGDDDAEDDDGVQWQTDTSAEAAQQRIREQLSAVTAEMVILSTDDVQKEKNKPKQIKNQVPEDGTYKPADLTGTKMSNHEALVRDITCNLEKGSTPAQLKVFLASLPGSPQEVMTAMVDSLFAGISKGISKEVGKKKKYIAAALQEGGEGSQLHLLEAIYVLCTKAGTDALKEIALVLKVLYDCDILEEEYIVEWYEKGLTGRNKDSQIWEKVKPFIDWLQTAESESDEE